MADSIHVRVLTDAGMLLEDDAVSVIAPGEVGYLGMLRNHAPLVTTLVPGKLIWRKATGESKTVVVGTGLLEIAKNHCTLLTSRISEPNHPAAAVHAA